MNSLIKIAICGMMAVAFNGVANAGALELQSTAAQALNDSVIARRWMSESLGVQGTPTLQALNAAIGKLPAAQQAAAVNAINSYVNAHVNVAGSAAKAKNEQSAKALFQTSNGQILKVAAMVTTAASRENISNAVAPGATCSIDQIASDLAKDTDVSFADAQAVVKSGALSLGGCAHDLISIGAQARGNALKIGKYELSHCATGGKVATGAAGKTCLINGAAEVLDIPADQAAKNIEKIGNECKYFN